MRRGEGRGSSLFVGLLASLVGMALGLLGDPVASVSDGVHFDMSVVVLLSLGVCGSRLE